MAGEVKYGGSKTIYNMVREAERESGRYPRRDEWNARCGYGSMDDRLTVNE